MTYGLGDMKIEPYEILYMPVRIVQYRDGDGRCDLVIEGMDGNFDIYRRLRDGTFEVAIPAEQATVESDRNICQKAKSVARSMKGFTTVMK